MLNALRDSSKKGFLKYILLGFLVMAGGGLVMMDVGGFFTGATLGSNNVAKGGGITITAPEFDRTVRRVLARQGIGPQEAYKLGMINQILASDIQQRLMTQQAHKMGIRIGDDVIKEQIAKLAESIAAGTGNKKDALQQLLRQQGISEAEFVESIRSEIGNALLRNAFLTGGATVPDALIRDMYKYEFQTRSAQAIVLKTDSVTGIDQPTDENLKKYYEANKAEFAIPETRTFTLATLNAEMIKKDIVITDEDTQAAYNDSIASFTKPERRKVQQAVIADGAQAEKIAAAVKDGKPLKDAVTSVTGNTKAYLGEDDYQQSGLLEEVAGPVFSAKDGDVVGPVQTALGYHVMVLVKALPPETVPFADVKKQIKDQLLQSRLQDDMLAAANSIDDRLAGGEPLENIVAEMGLTTEKIGPVRVNGMDETGKDKLAAYESDKDQILESAFTVDTGESAPLVETADGRFIAVRVDALSALSEKPFDDVRETLRKRWIREQKDLTNRARATDAMKKIEDGKPLADIARDMNARVENFNGLKRTSDAPSTLGPVAMAKIFTGDIGSTFMAETDSGLIVAKITDVKLGDAENASRTDLETLKNGEKRRQAEEILGSFVNDIAMRSDVEINQRLLEAMYAEPAAGQ